MRYFLFCVIVIASTCVASSSFAQAAIEVKSLDIPSEVTAVTLYRGRASVTRTATVQLDHGVHELNFKHLPETIQPQTLQARASGGKHVKVVAVDFLQQQDVEATSEQAAALDAEIERLQRELKKIADQRSALQGQQNLINAIGVKTTNDASESGGTEKLDLEVVRQQLAFIAEETAKIHSASRELDAQQRTLEKQLHVVQTQRNAIGGSNVVRAAVVMVAAIEPGEATLELSYLVGNATWEPTYNVRKSGAAESSTQIEYDAMVTQRTGEDWNDVKLTLSTAQPMLAANPPAISPWFVDVFRPDQHFAGKAPAPASAAEMNVDRMRSTALGEERDAAKSLEDWSADAAVVSGGPAVSFELPRAVTINSNVQKQQRTRIGTIDAPAKFVHVAVPLHGEAVYLRGDLVNASAYQLLPGRASIFVDQNYIGQTALDSVAPGSSFKVHFGIEPSVKVVRKLVTKNTENTGLLSGGRRTSYDYRISIDNGSGRPITLELWDRYPISRSSEITIDLVDLSDSLSTDAVYTAQEQPQGLLKWVLNIPATATGPASYVVSYGLRINRAKDIEMTPLPE